MCGELYPGGPNLSQKYSQSLGQEIPDHADIDSYECSLHQRNTLFVKNKIELSSSNSLMIYKDDKDRFDCPVKLSQYAYWNDQQWYHTTRNQHNKLRYQRPYLHGYSMRATIQTPPLPYHPTRRRRIPWADKSSFKKTKKRLTDVVKAASTSTQKKFPSRSTIHKVYLLHMSSQ